MLLDYYDGHGEFVKGMYVLGDATKEAPFAWTLFAAAFVVSGATVEHSTNVFPATSTFSALAIVSSTALSLLRQVKIMSACFTASSIDVATLVLSVPSSLLKCSALACVRLYKINGEVSFPFSTRFFDMPLPMFPRPIYARVGILRDVTEGLRYRDCQLIDLCVLQRE
jgi:hypothetical protein